jgi:hypothetical protein
MGRGMGSVRMSGVDEEGEFRLELGLSRGSPTFERKSNVREEDQRMIEGEGKRRGLEVEWEEMEALAQDLSSSRNFAGSFVSIVILFPPAQPPRPPLSSSPLPTITTITTIHRHSLSFTPRYTILRSHKSRLGHTQLLLVEGTGAGAGAGASTLPFAST